MTMTADLGKNASADPAPPLRDGTEVTKWKYDAFISYSHSQDRGLAKSLQRTIERWGSSVPGRRKLRVFRDETNLKAYPDLWEGIKDNLGQSGYFILMASPASARSPWVTKEVAQFMAKDGQARKRIGIVLTAGTLPWMKDGDPFQEESAIAPEVFALFKQEPLVIDLRPFRESQSGPEFSGRVATLVAAILNKDKDEVFGEHLSAQRRFIASLVGGILVLTLAIILAVVQFVEAKRQAKTAEQQTAEAKLQAAKAKRETARAEQQTAEAKRQEAKARRETERADNEAAGARFQAMKAYEQTVLATQLARRADEQTILATQQAQRADARAREATSRRLANQADRIAEARIDTALLLMAQGYRMADNTAIRYNWWRLLVTLAMPRAFLPVQAKSVRFEPDGSLVVGLEKGSATFRESDGAWRSTARPASAQEAVSAGAEPGETWQWSGNCEDESPVCSCNKWEPRPTGSYGDQDQFCIGSELTVSGWCSDRRFDVPGVQVAIRRQGPSVHVETDLGYGELACLEPFSLDGSDGRRPTLVAGNLRFFAGRAYVERIVNTGPSAISVAQSHDGRWLAVLRFDGGIEVWPGEGIPATAGRWGSTPLELPARALSVAASSQGEAVAIAIAPTRDGDRGGLMLWRAFAAPHLPPPPRNLLPGVWNDRRGSGGAIALSDDGALLAAGVDVDLHVWRAADLARPPQELYIGRNVATSADFSSDGKYLVVTQQPLDRALPVAMIFPVEGGPGLGPFATGAREACFHPADSDSIVTVGEKGVQLWSLSQRKNGLDILKEPAVALAVDRARGRIAVRLADEDIAIWDVKNGGSPIRSGRRIGMESVLAFMAGADALLWASDKGLEAWYWLEDTWFRIDDAAHRDAVALREGSVLGVTMEGQAVVYDLDPVRWLEQTCRLVGRNLTRREWNTYIGEAFPYECTCPDYGPGAGCSEAACPSD